MFTLFVSPLKTNKQTNKKTLNEDLSLLLCFYVADPATSPPGDLIFLPYKLVYSLIRRKSIYLTLYYHLINIVNINILLLQNYTVPLSK